MDSNEKKMPKKSEMEFYENAGICDQLAIDLDTLPDSEENSNIESIMSFKPSQLATCELTSTNEFKTLVKLGDIAHVECSPDHNERR